MTESGTFISGPWTFSISESHILKSDGLDRERYEKELKLPQLPEMTFPQNILRITHNEGFGIEFNALDALRLVDAENDLMKVSTSAAWKEARRDSEHINGVVNPFDWTYTTDYKGTLLRDGEKCFTVEMTKETIDYAKLKVEEKILFFATILLFEDELADNGASILSLKCRAMPSGYFILLRFYLRVDDVLVRVYDTRIQCDYEKKYILREVTHKECAYCDIKAPIHVITDANEVANHLPIIKTFTEKLIFPPLDS